MVHTKAVLGCSIRFAVLVVALFAFFAACARAQVAFSVPVDISKSSGTATDQEVALGPNGTVYIAWVDNSSGSYQVLFSRSTDGGATFSTPLGVSNAGASNTYPPQIAVDSGGNIVLAWVGLGTSAPVYFSRSTNAGVSFSAPSLDTPAVAPIQFALDTSGNVDVVWSSSTSSIAQAYFNRSTDGGTTFSAPVNVSNDSNAAVMPQIAVDSLGAVDVVWLDEPAGQSNYNNILFSSSANNGAAFSASVEVEAGSPNSTTAGSPQLLVGANHNIYLSWTEVLNAQDSSYFNVSTNGGATFSTPKEIAGVPDSAPAPIMALDPTGEIVAIVWQTGQSASTVDLMWSGDGGTTFSTVETVAPPYSTVPQIAIDSSGRFDIVYEAAQYQQYTNFGLTFTQSVSHTSFSPVQDIALGVGGTVSVDASGNIYIAWQQNSNNQTSIFLAHSIAAGLSSISLSAASVTGGSSTTGGVILSAPAPAGGATVSLSSSNTGAATVPLTVTVSAGSTSEMFNITTNAVTTSTSVVITASLGSTTQSATLTVVPASSGGSGGSGGSSGGSPSFSVTAKPTALTITAPGQSASTTLTFTSMSGLTGSGSLSSPTCGIAASEKISCALSAFTLPANGTATATITFASTASSGTAVALRQVLLLFLLPFALAPFAIRRLRTRKALALYMTGGLSWRLRPVALVFAIVAVIACTAVVGCGSTSKTTSSSTTPTNSGTPLGAVQGVNASITINGVTQTVPNLSLTVQ